VSRRRQRKPVDMSVGGRPSGRPPHGSMVGLMRQYLPLGQPVLQALIHEHQEELVAFVQVIQYQTSKIDQMRKVGDEWEAAAGDGGTARRVLVCKDRDNAGQHFTFAFFDSYETAMKNSNDPITQEFAQKMMSLADGPPTFYNLDVLDDRQVS